MRRASSAAVRHETTPPPIGCVSHGRSGIVRSQWNTPSSIDCGSSAIILPQGGGFYQW